MMKRNVLVGFFVIAALALFTTGLFLIGNRHEAFAQHVGYYAEFTNLSGLKKGAKVQVAGMDAGQIVHIDVPSSPAGRFRVQIRINDTLQGLVRTDSVATIATEGVVGDTFLLIRPGSPGAPAAPAQATLPSREPTDLAALLDQGQGLLAQGKGVLTDVDTTVKNANGVLGSVGGNMNTTLAVTRTTVGHVDDVVLGLQDGRGPAGMILRDEALAGHIREAVSNAQQATVNLNHASAQADTLVTDVQSRNLPQKIDDTLASVRSAASNIDTASSQLSQSVAEATAPDVQGVTAGTNIREALSNANAATTNLADDSEALKHNVFLRGFFRHRGYYNLEGIPADKYRKDRMFADLSSDRIWIAADKLFIANSGGTEQLSDAGKNILDEAVAKIGDVIAQSAIIVEGYDDAPSAAEQLTHSRLRAILVRRYLEDHFQLDPSHLGIVALESVTPVKLDRQIWDGVCIVLLRPKH